MYMAEAFQKTEMGRMGRNTLSSYVLSMRDPLYFRESLASEPKTQAGGRDRMETPSCKENRSDLTNVRPKETRNLKTLQDRGGRYVLTKDSIQQKHTRIVNSFVPSDRLYEAKTNKIEGENEQFYNNSWKLSAPLTIVDGTTSQEIRDRGLI